MLKQRTQSGRKVVNDVAQLSLICEQNSGTAVSFGPFPSSQTYRAIWPSKDGDEHGCRHVENLMSICSISTEVPVPAGGFRGATESETLFSDSSTLSQRSHTCTREITDSVLAKVI